MGLEDNEILEITCLNATAKAYARAQLNSIQPKQNKLNNYNKTK